jgi:hypothetical protein
VYPRYLNFETCSIGLLSIVICDRM